MIKRYYLHEEDMQEAPDGPWMRVEEISDKVLMPNKLTAENGAKYALSGEFYETINLPCEYCEEGLDEDGEECELCHGIGTHPHTVNISWTNIKKIYATAVMVLGEELK